MNRAELPNEVLALVHGPVGTIAHVEILLALRAAEPEPRTTEQAATAAHVSSAKGAESVLRDLAHAELIEELGGGQWRYAPHGAPRRSAVDLLAAMYNERPVTLVRALYERPMNPLHSFADAFRLRRDG